MIASAMKSLLFAALAHTVWQELYEELLMKYADGYAYDGHDTTYLGYPAWWLTEVGYMNGTAQPCDTPTGTC